ncbi:MAG: hypothetical protein WED07_02780 [Candidatus Freyarchaeum deiterrae]
MPKPLEITMLGYEVVEKIEALHHIGQNTTPKRLGRKKGQSCPTGLLKGRLGEELSTYDNKKDFFINLIILK